MTPSFSHPITNFTKVLQNSFSGLCPWFHEFAEEQIASMENSMLRLHLAAEIYDMKQMHLDYLSFMHMPPKLIF